MAQRLRQVEGPGENAGCRFLAFPTIPEASALRLWVKIFLIRTVGPTKRFDLAAVSTASSFDGLRMRPTAPLARERLILSLSKDEARACGAGCSASKT